MSFNINDDYMSDTMIQNTWDCEHFGRCINSSKCLTCGPTQRMLSLPEDKARKKAQNKVQQARINPNLPPEESWKQLEKQVVAEFKAVPTLKEYDNTHRTPGSGNLWFAPGDVVDDVVLAECKERGTVTARGEKTISIPKQHLDKIMEESKGFGYPVYIFRYSKSEDIYFTQKFEVLVEMVHEIKVLRRERLRLEEKVRLLEEEIRRLKSNASY